MKTSTVIELKEEVDSVPAETEIQNHPKTILKLLLALRLLVIIAMPLLMLGHVLWYFLRAPLPEISPFWSDTEPVVVIIEIAILAILFGMAVFWWIPMPGCDCEGQCSMDENRGNNETRVDAASRRLKHYKYRKWVEMKKKIIEEIKVEMNEDLKKRFELDNADSIQNWSFQRKDSFYGCVAFNAGKKCTKNFDTEKIYISYPISGFNTSVHLHFCCICKDYLAVGLPHPAVDCKLLKMLDQFQN